jgi:DNA ligase-1
MLFKTVAQAFASIEKISERLKITTELSHLFADATPHEAEILVNVSLGQLYPVYKPTQFLIGEKVMVEILAEFFSLPSEMVQKKTDRLSNVFSLFSSSNISFDKGYSIIDVFEALVGLEKIVGTGSVEIRIKHLITLLLSVDAQSADFIVRIIIGKLRLGFSHMTIIDALSKLYDDSKKARIAIEYAYTISADLGGIAFRLKEEGLDGIKNMAISIGTPIVPAAAERVTVLSEIIERINPVIVQPKYDGMRVQIHCSWTKQTPKIFMFSRHLHTISDMFPEFFNFLSQYKGPWKDVIFEGEVIAYDSNTGMILPFQETAKRKRKYNITNIMEEIPLKMIAFDILYSNGQSCFFKQHKERRAELAAFVQSLHSHDLITVIEEIITTDESTVSNYFYQQLDKGLEGIIAKKTDAPYTPGKRNFNWIKFKRSNSSHLNDTIDGVIVGYYYGKGRRAGFGIGALLVAIFNSNNDCFETIAKVGTGLSDQDWIALKKNVDECAVFEKPKEVICNNLLYPDVWVVPQIIVMIKADEITLSSMHTAGKGSDRSQGYALRFPRFVQLIEDKKIDQITTAHEIEHLYRIQKNKSF